MIKIVMIRITAKTEKGKEALSQHLEETKKLKPHQKAMQKMIGVVHTVTSQDPLIVQIDIRNKKLSAVVNPKHLIQEIVDTMHNNGATEEDYEVMVV